MKHIITALAIVASTTATAQFYSGNELLQRMDSGDANQNMLAMGYVAGVVDMTRGEYHCAPYNVTLGQVRDMVRNYIFNNPANRHMNGSVLVALPLVEIWPCPKKKGGNL
jgi:hypothetical protein